MFVFAAVVVVLLLALASSDMFLAQYSQDELSNMGVQEQWWMTIPSPSPAHSVNASGFFVARIPYRAVGSLKVTPFWNSGRIPNTYVTLISRLSLILDAYIYSINLIVDYLFMEASDILARLNWFPRLKKKKPNAFDQMRWARGWGGHPSLLLNSHVAEFILAILREEHIRTCQGEQ